MPPSPHESPDEGGARRAEGEAPEPSTDPKRTRITALTTLVATLFLLLAFSTDIIEGFTATIDPDWEEHRPKLPRELTLPVDALLLLAAVLVGPRARSEAGIERDAAANWVLVGVLGTLAADLVFVVAYERDVPVPWEVLLSLVYLPLLYVLWTGLLGHAPMYKRPAALTHVERRSIAAAIPLVIGVGAAYVGETLYWREVQNPGNHIDQEYFAQISQVIPLLAIALGFESKFTDRGRELFPAELAVGVFTILLLVVAEGLAISTLPVNNVDVFLYRWHEYLAFVVTLYACFVALAVLVAVLVVSLKPSPDQPDR